MLKTTSSHDGFNSKRRFANGLRRLLMADPINLSLDSQAVEARERKA